MTEQKQKNRCKNYGYKMNLIYLYSKKKSITLNIYKLHLELTSILHPITWNNKYNDIESKIKPEKYKKSNTINRKLNTLKQHNKNQEQKKRCV